MPPNIRDEDTNRLAEKLASWPCATNWTESSGPSRYEIVYGRCKTE